MKSLTTQEISSVSAAGTTEILTDVAIASGAGLATGLIVGTFVSSVSVVNGAIGGALIGAVAGTTVSLLHEYDVI